MRQSELFTKTRREAPKGEISKNASLLIRGGFVHKEMAGAYSYLPLGLRVLSNIEAIIRQEMNAIGGQELLLTALQDKELWDTSGRWSDESVDVWFKTLLKNGSEVGLGWTHEEAVTVLMKEHISSHRDLPRYVYQIQTKFRNEVRAKSGLMRGREFIMKDMYSFSADDASHEVFYERCKESYRTIFSRVGLGEVTYLTFASGGAFAPYSHEFQTLSPAGEDTIYVDAKQGVAVNKEVCTDEVLADLGLKREDLVEEKAIEVGNIFNLGTRFSEVLGLTYLDENGVEMPVVMGSYGIGPGRLMGTIVETLSDEKGIVWPDEVAPFQVHLVELSQGDDAVLQAAEDLYRKLQEKNIEVLFDDRDVRAGEKFADADLIGIANRVVVSAKTIQEGKVELTKRRTGESSLVEAEALFSL